MANDIDLMEFEQDLLEGDFARQQPQVPRQEQQQQQNEQQNQQQQQHQQPQQNGGQPLHEQHQNEQQELYERRRRLQRQQQNAHGGNHRARLIANLQEQLAYLQQQENADPRQRPANEAGRGNREPRQRAGRNLQKRNAKYWKSQYFRLKGRDSSGGKGGPTFNFFY